jgi:hypothetical protein
MKTVDKKREFKDYYFGCPTCFSRLHLVTRQHIDERPGCVCNGPLLMMPITEEMFSE